MGPEVLGEATNGTCKTKPANWRDGAGRKGQELYDRRKRKILGTQKSSAPTGEKGKNPRCVCSEQLSETHEFHGTKTRNHPERMSKTEKTASNVIANEL